jgi:hypothetical protein
VEVPLPSRRSPAVLVLGFLLAMAVGVGATLLVLERPQAAAPQPLPPPLVVEPARPTPADELVEVAPPAPTQVTFHIESVPPGATVTLEGKVLGLTPLDVERPAGADGRAVLEVTLTKDGYLPVSATAGGSGGRVELLQKLQPAPVEPPPKPAHLSPAGAPSQPKEAPHGSAPAVTPIEPSLPAREVPKAKVKPPSVKPVETPRAEKKPRPEPMPATRPASKLDEDDEPSSGDLKRPQP